MTCRSDTLPRLELWPEERVTLLEHGSTWAQRPVPTIGHDVPEDFGDDWFWRSYAGPEFDIYLPRYYWAGRAYGHAWYLWEKPGMCVGAWPRIQAGPFYSPFTREHSRMDADGLCVKVSVLGVVRLRDAAWRDLAPTVRQFATVWDWWYGDTGYSYDSNPWVWEALLRRKEIRHD